MMLHRSAAAAVAAALIVGCGPSQNVADTSTVGEPFVITYSMFRLTSDLSGLSEEERAMIPLLIDAAREMDAIFWLESYGDRNALLRSIEDPGLRRYAEINYGPWDRLNNIEPFLEGFGPKPAGAQFYPLDMTKEEFETAAASSEALKSRYTLVRRSADGSLIPIPYNEAFSVHVRGAADKIRQAARLSPSAALRKYLELRAEALLTDEYQPSDLAWMDMKDNVVEVVIGPIETYEDALFGYKAAHEAYVLIKDREWSRRLERYASLLPALQRGLPVPDRYKQEMPGTDSDLGAYDAIYYAGDANAGAKTIAINLPNDEEVQLRKGTRRLQLKNAIRAKFDSILVPISRVLIVEDQQRRVTFDAFFGNTMFHEVAHGLGIKNTVTGRGTVRDALREYHSALEEGKADILGLYMVSQLRNSGEIEVDPMDSFVTFLAGIFRSIRFGAASAHGQANMVRFNFFKEHGAFERTPDRRYRVHQERMTEAMNALSERILTLQGEGNYSSVESFVKQYGTIDAQLQADLDLINAQGIPVDIVFEQGMSVL